MKHQKTTCIEPLDAWRRTLDVVIASAPVGHDTLVMQQLQDAMRSYQQHGPIQRVTTGERKAFNQMTYLAVGQLLQAAPQPINRLVSKNLTVQINGTEHDVSGLPGAQAGNTIELSPANLPPVIERDAFGFTRHARSFDTASAANGSHALQPADQPGTPSASELQPQIPDQASLHSAMPSPSSRVQADHEFPSVQPDKAKPFPYQPSDLPARSGGFVDQSSCKPL